MNELFYYPFIKSSSIEFDRIELTENQKQSLLLREGDLLFSRTSVVADGVGKCTYIKSTIDELAYDSNIFRIRLDGSRVSSLFYYYYFTSPEGRSKVKSLSSGAAVTTISGTKLSGLSVPYPPIHTQRRIADILSAYDDLIENNTRRIRILEGMAQAIYQEWFGKVDASAESLPKGWEIMAYTDAIDVMSGGTPRTSVPEYWDGDIPWFTPQDLDNSFYVLDTTRKITELGLSKCNSKLYPENAVFITARGTVGKIVLAAVPMAMSQTNYALIGNNGISQFWVYLMTKELVDVFKKKATGAVFDTIVVDTFRQQEIIKPQAKLIEKFHQEIEPVFRLLKNLQMRNVNLRQTRDLLLPRLVSGEVEV
jgi:type I restriction enzyme, S subunit